MDGTWPFQAGHCFYFTQIIIVPCRQVTQLLKEIIFFVGDDQYNGGGKHGDPLEMEFSINDRERQKLLREQNILKQVHILRSLINSKLLVSIIPIYTRN